MQKVSDMSECDLLIHVHSKVGVCTGISNARVWSGHSAYDDKEVKMAITI